jgi:hypothetical protein
MIIAIELSTIGGVCGGSLTSDSISSFILNETLVG